MCDKVIDLYLLNIKFHSKFGIENPEMEFRIKILALYLSTYNTYYCGGLCDFQVLAAHFVIKLTFVLDIYFIRNCESSNTVNTIS